MSYLPFQTTLGQVTGTDCHNLDPNCYIDEAIPDMQLSKGDKQIVMRQMKASSGLEDSS